MLHNKHNKHGKAKHNNDEALEPKWLGEKEKFARPWVGSMGRDKKGDEKGTAEGKGKSKEKGKENGRRSGRIMQGTKIRNLY